MSFTTSPPGAQLAVDGKPYTCPCDVSLKRKHPHPVVISMPGYRTVSFSIDPQWDGISLIGNLIIPGGSVGLVADRVSGADMNFYELAEIRLAPCTQPSMPPLVLNDFKGHLLTNEEVARAVVADRHDRSQFFRGQP